MSECKFEELIDGYLLNKLDEEQQEKFERHYFECPTCFQEMSARHEIIAAIKLKGEEIFRDQIAAEQKATVPLIERILGVLTPRQWTAAAASAALILVIAFGIIPNLKSPESPQFTLTDEGQMRGRHIVLISESIPKQFQWEEVEGAVEYRIYIDNHEPIWTETTEDNFIVLPDDVKARLRPGVKYFWQVKAFSRQGTLIAESSKVQFIVAID